jgi:dethiobiotin synthetase
MRYFFDRGAAPFYFKPMQTGCRHPYDTDSDAKFIYENIPELSGKDPACSVGFCYRNPKAPFFAARNEGRQVDCSGYSKTSDEKDPFCAAEMSSCGGVFVPIDGKAGD